MRSLPGTPGQASGGADQQVPELQVSRRTQARADRGADVRSDQGTRDLENHIVRCVLRRAYLAAASTRGSELGCVVLGDSNLTFNGVRDVMSCMPQELLEVADLGSTPQGGACWPLASSLVSPPHGLTVCSMSRCRMIRGLPRCFMFVV